MPKKIELGPIETVCVYYEVMSGRRDWKTAWRLAKGKPADEVIDSDSPYYKWIMTVSFKNTVFRFDKELEKKEHDLQEKVRRDFKKNLELGITTDGKGEALATDFRNREQFLNWLNQQVNLVSDDKMRVDYLKMLSDLMRFKEADNKDKEQDIQRFYTPLQCQECKLYQMQRDKING